jgi:polyisoprenoid-binding protein YceI
VYFQASLNSSLTCSHCTSASGRSEISCFGTRPRWGFGFWHKRRGTLRKTSRASFIAALVILIGQLAPAQNQSIRVVLDPAQTEIHWKLSGLHSVHGTFKLKSGEFLFNPKTGLAEGEILVDATTGESRNPARDKRMQDEVLESNRYPAIFYHPTEIKGPFKAGEGTQDLTGEGTFNIHGADHPPWRSRSRCK